MICCSFFSHLLGVDIQILIGGVVGGIVGLALLALVIILIIVLIKTRLVEVKGRQQK